MRLHISSSQVLTKKIVIYLKYVCKFHSMHLAGIKIHLYVAVFVLVRDLTSNNIMYNSNTLVHKKHTPLVLYMGNYAQVLHTKDLCSAIYAELLANNNR